MRKLLLFALPFGVGTLLCQYVFPASLRVWLGVMATAACTAALRRKGKRGRTVGLTAAGLGLGILWFSSYAAFYLAPAEALAGTGDTVRLELLDYAEETAGGARCEVRVLEKGLPGKAVYNGSRRLLKLEPGDRVRTEAKFYSAVHVADEESAYYTSQGIYLRLYAQKETVITGGNAGSPRYLPQRMAKNLKDTAEEIYGQPAAGLITALLTGTRDGLDIQSSTRLSEAGLMHITAVSGLHCTFLIGMLGLFTFRRQRLTALLGYPVLLFYMVLTGCTPSAARSCVMIGFVLLAPLLDREADPPTSLSGALLVILLANPFAIGSVSLQLSFAAAAGLLLISPKIYDALKDCRSVFGWMPRLIRNFILGTISASLGVMALTAPLSAVYFGTLSLVSPIANLMVLWMAPVLFGSALIVTALCTVWTGFAPLAVFPEFLARYLLWTANALSKLPGHSVRFTGPLAALWLLMVYAMLLICVLSRDRRRKYAVAAVAAAVCLLAAKALPVMSAREGELTAVAVDVGQGAATLLHSGGSTVLVDCGSLGSSRGPGEAVAAAMETYGWNRLDYVGLTHYHEDHANGLNELLAYVEVGGLLLPRLEDSLEEDLREEVLALAERYDIPVTYVEIARTKLEIGQALLTVFPPVSEGEANEEGLTFLCTAGEFDLLITGDMAAETERELVDTYTLPDIEILIAGHHGSRYSTSRELLEEVTPEVGIISVGAGNRFGHPAPEAVGRMTSAGMTVFRTDWHGNILIRVHQREELLAWR